jgi:hypothetical protein
VLWSPRVDDVDRAGQTTDNDPRILKKAISISYLVVLSPSLPLEFSRKGSLLYYNPLPHQLSRNESLAGITIGADTCRGGTARSGDERTVSDIRSHAGE